jgi:hypothetical protein
MHTVCTNNTIKTAVVCQAEEREWLEKSNTACVVIMLACELKTTLKTTQPLHVDKAHTSQRDCLNTQPPSVTHAGVFTAM